MIPAALLLVGHAATWTKTGYYFLRRVQLQCARADFERYVDAVRRGAIPLDAPRAGYVPPDLPWYAPTVEAASMDSYGNVYLLTALDMNFDEGLVSRVGDSPFEGDGFSPRVHAEPLLANWWVFFAQ